DFMVSVKSCRQKLLFGSIRKQVSGDLPSDKLIIRHILVEGMNDPIPPRPLGAVIIILITMRIGIPGHLHPMSRHFFSIAFLSQELVNDLLIGILAIIGQKAIYPR